MMDLFRSWLLGIIVTALILSLVNSLIPSEKNRVSIRMIGGLVLLASVLMPLGRLDPVWKESYDGYTLEIQRQIDEYRGESLDRMEEIIARQAAAYIADKGNEMGVKCHPSVTTRLENGVPIPDTVTMDVPQDNELAECIAADLAIPKERQFWQER